MGVSAEKHAANLRRAIQTVLERGLHDPRVKGIVSVSRLNLSPDYANATVFVTVMPEQYEELTLHGLQAAEGHVRSQVSRRAKVRRVPALHFRLDVKARKEAEVFSAIADAVREDEERAAKRDASPGSGEAMDGTDTATGQATGPTNDAGNADEALAAFDAFVDDASKRVGGSLSEPDGEHDGPKSPETEDRGS